jgi:hypothetical protein
MTSPSCISPRVLLEHRCIICWCSDALRVRTERDCMGWCGGRRGKCEREREWARSDSIIQIDVGSATTNEPKLTRLPTHLYSTPSAGGVGGAHKWWSARAQFETCTPSFLTSYRRKDRRAPEFCAIAAGRSPRMQIYTHMGYCMWRWREVQSAEKFVSLLFDALCYMQLCHLHCCGKWSALKRIGGDEVMSINLRVAHLRL